MANINSKPLPVLSESDLARFWSKVDKRGPDECWPWKGARTGANYGGFWLARAMYGAHRIALFLHSGIDPAPLFACHRCDNPPCCNGAHLFAGTYQDNASDKVFKGRQAAGDRNGGRIHLATRARGTKNGSSKLTPEAVLEIRKMYADGLGSYQDLGDAFGVSDTVIGYIVRRKWWRHV